MQFHLHVSSYRHWWHHDGHGEKGKRRKGKGESGRGKAEEGNGEKGSSQEPWLGRYPTAVAAAVEYLGSTLPSSPTDLTDAPARVPASSGVTFPL